MLFRVLDYFSIVSFSLSTYLFRLCLLRPLLVRNAGALQARCVSPRRRPPERGPRIVFFWGGQNYGTRSVLNRDCREDKGGQSTPLSQLPPLCPDLCAVWRCRAGGIDPTSCLA